MDFTTRVGAEEVDISVGIGDRGSTVLAAGPKTIVSITLGGTEAEDQAVAEAEAEAVVEEDDLEDVEMAADLPHPVAEEAEVEFHVTCAEEIMGSEIVPSSRPQSVR
ncbi:MAG: hypothetical protein Aurels2KO_57580 [Aureliella sp.]